MKAGEALDLLDANTRWWRLGRNVVSAAPLEGERILARRRRGESLSEMVIRLAERVYSKLHIEPGAQQEYAPLAAGDVQEPSSGSCPLGQVASQAPPPAPLDQALDQPRAQDRGPR